jgi:cyclopropane fatty-acyl-phospholipid synthase-like methyltransferase
MTDPTLHHPRYVRSNGYDPLWIARNQMGPHPLWLLENLTEVMPFEPGMKVLDLGCGRALTSIFLAREFGVNVWAADLWIAAEDNQQRIDEAGLAALITPVHTEAHALPFEAGFFDAVVSIDAFQYFGTDDLYLGYLLDFVKPGGRLGAVMPATTRELGEEIPATLEPYWEWDFCCWHTAEWWRAHWAKTRKVDVDHADMIEDAWRDWLQFNDFIAPHVEGWWVQEVAATHDMLLADRGTELGFARIVGSKRQEHE